MYSSFLYVTVARQMSQAARQQRDQQTEGVCFYDGLYITMMQPVMEFSSWNLSVPTPVAKSSKDWGCNKVYGTSALLLGGFRPVLRYAPASPHHHGKLHQVNYAGLNWLDCTLIKDQDKDLSSPASSISQHPAGASWSTQYNKRPASWSLQLLFRCSL